MNIAARIAFTCVLALSACSPPAPAPATETAAVTTEAAAPSEGAPTMQTLAGRWGDNGDCTKDLILNADGTFRSYTGGGGTWTLQGDLLTMTGDGGTFQVRIAMAGPDTLMVGQPDGSFGMSQRCP